MNDLENRLWPDLKEIKYLVYENETFIVWIDMDIDIDWSLNDKYDEKYHPDEEKQNALFNYVATLECIPSDHLKENIRLNYKRMIGEAIVRNLKNDFENAFKMAKSAEMFILERNKEHSRLWYLTASGLSAIIITFLGLVLWLSRIFIQPIFGETTFYVLLASCGGALGALFSVIMRIGKMDLNPAGGIKLHYAEGVSRIVAGMISAIIIASCVKLQLLIPIFTNTNNTQLAMILAGIFAGISERWIPSLVTKIENNSNKKSK